jgi:hypothetical protein
MRFGEAPLPCSQSAVTPHAVAAVCLAVIPLLIIFPRNLGRNLRLYIHQRAENDFRILSVKKEQPINKGGEGNG